MYHVKDKDYKNELSKPNVYLLAFVWLKSFLIPLAYWGGAKGALPPPPPKIG